MDGPAPLNASGRWTRRGWRLVLAGLLLGHGWLTLELLGPEATGSGLLDDRPLLSGRHALHLYHGALGAQAWQARGRSVAYDPAFYAGYPVTPLFDSECQLARLSAWLRGGAAHPAPYKCGLAIAWGMLPLLLFGAARALEGGQAAGCLAALLGMIVCWSDFGRERLALGEGDFLAGCGLGVLAVALLLRYHARPLPGSWLALTLVAGALCFFHLSLLAWLLPVVLTYYFVAGGQHRLAWHVGLLVAFALALAGNWFWWLDAAQNWWIQADAGGMNSDWHPTFDGIHHHPLWKDAAHRGLAFTLLSFGGLGLLTFAVKLRWTAACVSGAALLSAVAVALYGSSWEPPVRLEPARFLLLGLLLATLPAVEAARAGVRLAGQIAGSPRRGLAIAGVLLVIPAALWHEPLAGFVRHCLSRDSLPMGWPAELAEAFARLRRHTSVAARILWEETAATDAWTPLLPVQTERFFLSGLGSDTHLEHAAHRLADGQLAGRPLAAWSDAELAEFCRRYNVGWVVGSTPAAHQRLRTWSAARPVTELFSGTCLYALQREPSYLLIGQGHVLRCDARGLTLADVEPVDGHVILSFHHHPGIVSSNDRVRVEKEPQLYDAIPFVRLRMSAPLSRLTLYWQD